VNWRKYGSKRELRMLGLSIAAIVGLCLVSVPAQAHKVNVFAYVEGDQVVVEGYFSGSVKAQDCPIEVFDEAGAKIRDGKTDSKGIYSFNLADLPAFAGGLRVVLQAGMGHKAEYTLGRSDIPGVANKEAPLKEKSPKDVSENAPGPTVDSPSPAVDQTALMAALEAVLDKKLDPLVRMLGKQEKLLLEEKYGGPRIKDIVGGLGWIVGIVGLIAFFWGRSRSGKRSSD